MASNGNVGREILPTLTIVLPLGALLSSPTIKTKPGNHPGVIGDPKCSQQSQRRRGFDGCLPSAPTRPRG